MMRSTRVELLNLGLVVGLLAGAPGSVSVLAQKSSGPVVVQPGAPGKPSKILPAGTRAKLPKPSPDDIKFMQGMIMHHAQAVEMTALINSRTENSELRTLGARISRSQDDEIKFMRRWLISRGQAETEPMAGMDHSQHMNHGAGAMGAMGAMGLMPGMLSPQQMEALRKAQGTEFDRLFLEGMIQHHGGALTMVKELFEKPGSGQDAEIFNFVTDVDSGQRAEIRIMQGMLEKNASKEKR